MLRLYCSYSFILAHLDHQIITSPRTVLGKYPIVAAAVLLANVSSLLGFPPPCTEKSNSKKNKNCL